VMDRIYAPWRSKYFSIEKGSGCLFCEIQKADDREVGILKRGEHWFVILNSYPYTSGHVMVVANRHIDALNEMGEEEGKELVELLKLCERAIEEAYKPNGINVGVNRGSSAGAGIVGHLHFHVVPRWEGDTNFMTSVAETRVVSESLEDSYSKLISYFEKS